MATTSDHNMKSLPPLIDQALSKPPPETSRSQRGGRRKSKAAAAANESTQKQKKQPQRGLGVEQLERLRLKERWNKLTEMNMINTLHNHNQNQNHPFVSSSSFAEFGAFGGGVSNGGVHLGLNQWFHGQNGNMTAFKEVSSTPNVIKCFSNDHHCGFCHKKKRVNGENLAGIGPSINGGYGFSSFNVGNNHNIHVGNQDFGTKPGYAAVGNTHQSVEVIAVHKKGNSSGGGGGVIKEYEFFPEKKNGKSFSSSFSSSSTHHHNDLMMKMMNCSESSSVIAERDGVEATAHCVSGFESSTSIDLSLKLY